MTATKKATAKTAKTVKTEKVQDAQNIIMGALETRLAKLAAIDGLTNQVTAMRNIIKRTSDAQLNAAMSKLTQTDFNSLAQVIAHCDNAGKGQEQVKTIEKIVRFMGAVAIDSATPLCNYLKIASVVTMRESNPNVTELTCALSRKAFETRDTFKVREGFNPEARYSVGTGSSQSAQARQVFNRFGFYDGFVKGGKDNAPILNDYGRKVLTDLVFVK